MTYRPKVIDWTPERDEQLRALWLENITTREMARRMDLSKNAIIGRAHRLGLPKRKNPLPRKAWPKGQPTMYDLLPDQCRWPIGEVREPGFHFCGAQVSPGKVYCPDHCARAYTKITEPRHPAPTGSHKNFIFGGAA